MRRIDRSSALLCLLLTLATASQSGAALKLICPDSFLPGVPFLVRVEVLNSNGEPDREVWDAQAVLSADQSSVSLSTNRVQLRNGLGTALLVVQGTSGFKLKAAAGGQEAIRSVNTLAGQPVQTFSGTLAGTSTSWNGIVNVTGPLTVPAGHTLTIQPGTLVMISGAASGSSGVGIIVNGSVQSLGTEASPVTITSSDASLNWGQIRHDNASPSTYLYTFISKAGRAAGEGHTGTGPAIRPTNSTLVFDHCVISDLDAGGSTIGKIMMASGSSLTFLNSVLTRARMGPEIATTSLACTNTYISDMRGPDDCDGIYLHDAGGKPLVLSGCVISAGDDDAIDTLDSNVTVENSILRDWFNPNEDAKGISVFHGEVVLNRCLIVNCFDGASAKSSGSLAVMRLDHCTVVGLNRGVAAAWKSNATAGNVNIYLTNSIVEGVDAFYSDFGPAKFVSVTYCLAPEPWPGAGNVVDDPGFANPAAGDYHLRAGSPAIDAGDPAYPLDPNGTRTEIGFYPTDLAPASLVARITSPVNGAMYVAPTNLLVSATATSTTGTVAKVEFFEDGKRLAEDLTAPYTCVWSAQKIGTFLLTAVATDNGGRTATSAPVSVSLLSGDGPSTNTLVAAGSVWSYLDDGSDQGTAWRESGFNSSAWKTGRAKLGYGDGDETTVLSYGPSSSSKYVTYYFRQKFVLDDASRVTTLYLNLLRDDGAVVYLNGQEIYRVSMPAGVIDYRTYATTASEYSWELSTLGVAGLRSGTNVLAVEVHQGNASSSDLALDLELRAVSSAPANSRPLVAMNNPADGATIAAPGGIVLTANAQDLDGAVTNVSFFANDLLVGSDSSAPYSFTWSNIPAGVYTLTATAADDKGATGKSAAVSLNVSTNTAAPRILSQSPSPGPTTSLNEITVTFSKPVAGVEAGDLLVNGMTAVRVSGAIEQYTFVLPSLPPGPVAVTWAANHGIADTFTPPHVFDGSAPGATWQYQFTDATAPFVRSASPVAGSTVPVLTNVMVTFSETVLGVNASDLLVNAVPATTVVGAGAGPYAFSFAQPAEGTVTFTWAATHGIHDQAGIPFVASPWKLVLDPRKVGIVINEIMYHPASENPLEEFIEIFNRESWAINLQGWKFGDAVDFVFPNISIPAGGYLVVAADLATFRAKYPAVTNVLGNWSGILSNSREDIDLLDAQGNTINSVRYADEGDWGVRQRGLSDHGHRGWVWSAEHDAMGKTLELLNPGLDNDGGQAWAPSSVPQGTPGSPNSVLTSDVAPLIRHVVHTPLVPKSTDSVVVTAQIQDQTDAAPTVTLSYRIDTLTPGAFKTLVMRDDGLSGDAVAGDGLYSVRLPAQTNNTVVEFYLTAVDSGGLSRNWPGPAIGSVDGAGPSGQVANALFQVDDTVYTGKQPLYKIIMREEERVELEAIDNNVGGAATSDAQMNATFISIDAGGSELHYLAGVRNRGHGTRTAKPNNFRVNFRSDDTSAVLILTGFGGRSLAVRTSREGEWFQVRK